MNPLLLGISFALTCSLNGLQEENTFLDKESVDLEVLPLEKLLEMRKELRKKEHHPVVRRTSAFEETEGKDAASASVPGAMALRQSESRDSATGSSMQTAFQMSLTVLSFLAFGGYVISLVTQNMRRLQQSTADGATAPLHLKTVVVNQNRRPGLLRPTGTMTAVNYARRKRSRGFT